MPSVETRRHTRIGIGSRTQRGVGPASTLGFDHALTAAPGVAGAIGVVTPVTTTQPEVPPGLWIPGRTGPDVGLSNPSALTNYSGPSTLSVNTSITDKTFAGGQQIKAQSGATVTLTNCWHKGRSSSACFNADYPTGGFFVMTDCKISDENGGAGEGIYGPATALRVNIFGQIDGMKPQASGARYTMCHIHGHSDEVGAHTDGTQQVSGDNTVYEYCNFSGLRKNGSRVSGTIFLKPFLSGHSIDQATVDHCYLGGGGYTFRQNYAPAAPGPPTNTIMTNNVWGNDYQYGHILPDMTGTILTWTNNKDVLGATIPNPRP